MIYLLKTAFSKEIKSVRNLVKLAFAVGKINRSDIDVLNNEVEFLQVSQEELHPGNLTQSRLQSQLQKDRYFQFRLVYRLTRKMMKKDSLSARKERILKALIGVFESSTQRIHELVTFIKYNIQAGHTMDDSYARFGYHMYLNRRAFA